jgi:hypothetical protein
MPGEKLKATIAATLHHVLCSMPLKAVTHPLRQALVREFPLRRQQCWASSSSPGSSPPGPEHEVVRVHRLLVAARKKTSASLRTTYESGCSAVSGSRSSSNVLVSWVTCSLSPRAARSRLGGGQGAGTKSTLSCSSTCTPSRTTVRYAARAAASAVGLRVDAAVPDDDDRKLLQMCTFPSWLPV